jgi:hypothetical protein
MRLDRIRIFDAQSFPSPVVFQRDSIPLLSGWCQGSISTIPFTFLLIVLHMRMMGARGTFTRNELPNRVPCDLRLGD